MKLDGVGTAREIHYWGHYPVADMEFETDAPVSVGLRTWSPFLPGQVVDSMLPGIVFEVHVRNTSGQTQAGAVALSFPGPTSKEAGGATFERQSARAGHSSIFSPRYRLPAATARMAGINSSKARSLRT